MSLAVAAAMALFAGYTLGRREAQADLSWRPHLPPGCASKDTASIDAALEVGRGRDAADPTEIPARGWADILWRTANEVIEDRLLAVAAGVAFFALLAIFPAIAALVSLYGLFADASTVAEHVSALSFVLPPSAVDIIADQAARIASKSSNTLGTAFLISLAIALWSANAGMKAMFDALNVVYGEREKRNIVMFNLEAFAFTIGALALMLAALGGIVVLPAVLTYLGLETTTERVVNFVRWPILMAALIGGVALVYRFGPSRREARWHWITWGSVFAAVGWVGTSILFSWYLANVATYNETYGSLGATIGFMTWMWLSVFVILVGGELNAEMERQTARDTTVGHEKPLGWRGATVADTLGAAKHW